MRLLAVIVVVGTSAGLAVNFAQGRISRLPIRGRADGIDVVGIDDRDGTRETMAAKRKVYDQGGG
jgi:hypothetical protein